MSTRILFHNIYAEYINPMQLQYVYSIAIRKMKSEIITNFALFQENTKLQFNNKNNKYGQLLSFQKVQLKLLLKVRDLDLFKSC